jgi:O-6-methylguanine DNA methyltransferase
MKNPPVSISLGIKTRDGEFIACYSSNGLVELGWPKSGRVAKGKVIPAQVRSWHKLTESALKKILAGKSAGKLPPLDWSGKTEFQKAVWRAMLKIPAGQTRSYGEVAAAIGKPKAVRAVGGACGANPIPVLVPCHRILAANKRIGGFSGGLAWKRKLLAGEGVVFADSSAS